MSLKKFKKAILFSVASMLFVALQSSTVFASTEKTSSELERIFSGKSTQEEKNEYVKSVLNEENPNTQTSKISEYELCKLSDKENGKSPNQEGSKTKEYLKHLKELSKKSKSELKAKGYTDERINVIMNFKTVDLNNTDTVLNPVTDMYALASSATVYATANLGGFYHDGVNGGRTYKTLVYLTSGWYWTEAPFFNFSDGFATAWAASTNLQLKQIVAASEYYYVTNANYVGEVDYSIEAWNERALGLNGASFEFPVGRAPNRAYPEYAKTGYMLSTLVSTDYYINSLSTNLAYAHSQIQASPNFSINASGSIDAGINFEPISKVTRNSYFWEK